ncbi:NADH dehydrogenase subunit 3 [Trifolium medium]|uniref:NADH dehydrogenase subunit 3 n=1 Tax=Trifolium medium TaxID=97028 RepID=A0A392R847_9FABA|nr:NADH dehydrogenase subunit 3 [Trifolium medium]
MCGCSLLPFLVQPTRKDANPPRYRTCDPPHTARTKTPKSLPSSTYPEKLSAYECGFDPFGDTRSRKIVVGQDLFGLLGDPDVPVGEEIAKIVTVSVLKRCLLRNKQLR